MTSGVAAALRSEVEELRKVEAEVEQLRKRRDEGKVCLRGILGQKWPPNDENVCLRLRNQREGRGLTVWVRERALGFTRGVKAFR